MNKFQSPRSQLSTNGPDVHFTSMRPQSHRPTARLNNRYTQMKPTDCQSIVSPRQKRVRNTGHSVNMLQNRDDLQYTGMNMSLQWLQNKLSTPKAKQSYDFNTISMSGANRLSGGQPQTMKQGKLREFVKLTQPQNLQVAKPTSQTGSRLGSFSAQKRLTSDCYNRVATVHINQDFKNGARKQQGKEPLSQQQHRPQLRTNKISRFNENRMISIEFAASHNKEKKPSPRTKREEIIPETVNKYNRARLHPQLNQMKARYIEAITSPRARQEENDLSVITIPNIGGTPVRLGSKTRSSKERTPFGSPGMLSEKTSKSKKKEYDPLGFPMTAKHALNVLDPILWECEKQELKLKEYETVYFFNINERIKQKDNKKLPGGIEQGKINEATNHGFDAYDKEYAMRLNEHIGYRYEIVRKLGKGSFGIVLRCFDHKENEIVALKILKNQRRLYKQGLIESGLIEHLNVNDPEDTKNIIRRLHHFVFRKHLCLTFELLSLSLFDFINLNPRGQGFQLSFIKRFAIQMVISLYYMKQNNICHCDLKPENILLKTAGKSGIKIIDFGAGCFQDQQIYTYIQSRFYRAPEILLGMGKYTAQIDMWSFGCILYELYTGGILFYANNAVEHFRAIMEVKGTPPKSIWEKTRDDQKRKYFQQNGLPHEVIDKRGKIQIPGSRNIYHQFMNQQQEIENPEFLDFIDKCIEWQEEFRMTPEDAFLHPFISDAVSEMVALKEDENPDKTKKSKTELGDLSPSQLEELRDKSQLTEEVSFAMSQLENSYYDMEVDQGEDY